MDRVAFNLCFVARIGARFSWHFPIGRKVASLAIYYSKYSNFRRRISASAMAAPGAFSIV